MARGLWLRLPLESLDDRWALVVRLHLEDCWRLDARLVLELAANTDRSMLSHRGHRGAPEFPQRYENLPKHRAGRNMAVSGLLADYRSDTYDEMVASTAPRGRTPVAVRSPGTAVCQRSRGARAVRARSFLQQGITFSSSGEEWVFPLDLVPRLIAEDEWDHVEAGVVQRVRALEAFLDDIYGDSHVLRDGVVPYSLVFTSSNFCRAGAGIRPASGVRIHLAGIDLVRGADGVIRVLEDNIRVPSGISYVIENRRR